MRKNKKIKENEKKVDIVTSKKKKQPFRYNGLFDLIQNNKKRNIRK